MADMGESEVRPDSFRQSQRDLQAPRMGGSPGLEQPLRFVGVQDPPICDCLENGGSGMRQRGENHGIQNCLRAVR